MKYSTIAVNPPAATINNPFINIFDLEILPKNNPKKNNVLRLIIIANQVAMIISIIPNNERKKGIKHSTVVNTEDKASTIDTTTIAVLEALVITLLSNCVNNAFSKSFLFLILSALSAINAPQAPDTPIANPAPIPALIMSLASN